MEAPLPASPRGPHQSGLLIYDAQCRLCVAAKEGLDRTGSGIRMIPYESQEAMLALGEHYRPGPPTMAYLVSRTGIVVQGLEAFLPFVPGLPGGQVIRWMLRRTAVRALAEWGYRLIARHRYRLSGSVDPARRSRHLPLM